jgi:localization factor PodJL
MKLGVPWGVKGIRAEARETAQEAARRSGMSLEDWLNSVILRQAELDGIKARADSSGGAANGDDIANMNQRLDDLTRRIEQITRTGPAAYAPRHNRGDETIPTRPLAPSLAPEAPQLPPDVQLPPGLDRAVAEISARRRALNGDPAPMPAAYAPVPPPPMPADATAPVAAAPAMAAPPSLPPAMAAAPSAPQPSQNLAGLEAQLRRITDQIETLRKPGVEDAINALRAELGAIGQALSEALPRGAIEALEKQILELAMRIDHSHQAGIDPHTLAGIDSGLAEVRNALHSLTPAENLVGFNEAIENLTHKIDLIVAERDPATMQQLEHAIITLREMAEHVASNEAVTQVANEVAVLGEKIDYVARATAGGDALNNLDHRVSAIADSLAERTQNGDAVPPRLESLVQSLSDKIEQLQASRSEPVSLGHLEERIGYLAEKLDASQSRLGQMEAIERGLSDVLALIEEMRADKAAQSQHFNPAPAVDELRTNMVQTQDALEAVHDTLALMVDRLATIEKGVRSEPRSETMPEDAPAPPFGKLGVRLVSDSPAQPPQVMPPQPVVQPPAPTVQAPPLAPQVEPQQPPAPPPPAAPVQPPQVAPPRRVATSLPIKGDSSADEPLEPGSGPPKFSARIAASEAALGAAAPPAPAPGGKSNFIAAARRAAQAAMQQNAGAAAPRAEAEPEAEDATPSSLRSRLMKRMKSVFIAASIIAIVVGGFQIAGNFLKFGGHPTGEIARSQDPDNTPAPAPAPKKDTLEHPLDPLSPPAKQVPAPQKLNLNTPHAPSLFDPPVLSPPAQQSGAPPATKDDVTGSIPQTAATEKAAAGDEQLPAAIGGERLRSAALAGDAGAAYEIAARYAEGRGVPANPKEAAHWFAQAAEGGIALAQFRYASMLEKGQGVKKDQRLARQFYLAAAKQGHAKAMHNLAVLYAQGIDGKPDFGNAVKWFSQAAQHGVADSQYNLGVLLARGLGTNRDFVASYKWFSLAAAQGDQESAKKRDEIAKHLDAAALAAAKQATKTFSASPQLKTATAVPKPQGGWDQAGNNPQAAPQPKAKAAPAPAHQGTPLSLGSFTVGKQ